MTKNKKHPVENKIKIPHVPFYFVRHGQTDYNKDNKIMGQIDIPLNSVGLEQAQVVAKILQNLEISHIVSSPLKRAKQTSEIIASTLNRPVTIIDELMQNYLGIWEGRNKEEFLNETGIENLFEHLKMGGHIEGAESWPDFVSRISVGLDLALTKNIHNETPILIVAHKPTYWAISHILNAQIVEIEAKNCGVYFFSPPDSNSNGWTVNVLCIKT
jgi:broad specificity phosphatase PhoE